MNTKVQTPGESTDVEARPERQVVAPRCDIYESDQAVIVTAEMPGVSPDAVDVTLERNVLTLQGRTRTSAPSGLRLLWREFEPVDYRRSFELGSAAEGAGIQAVMQNGVLRVEVPKRVPVQRRITVTAG